VRVHWGWDDLRIVGDIVLGSLLAGGLRLVVMKAFLEPAAMFLGQRAYRQADKALGDRLPDLFGKKP
jgi:hypothetical protein